MRLYIDDDSVDPQLIRLLRRDGHEVQAPADVGLTGQRDQVHLGACPRIHPHPCDTSTDLFVEAIVGLDLHLGAHRSP